MKKSNSTIVTGRMDSGESIPNEFNSASSANITRNVTIAAPTTGGFNPLKPSISPNKLLNQTQTHGSAKKRVNTARDYPKIEMERPRMRPNIEKLG